MSLSVCDAPRRSNEALIHVLDVVKRYFGVKASLLQVQEPLFDKNNTKFIIFGKFEFDIRWNLKQTIEKIKEYGLDHQSAKSWGDLSSQVVYIYNESKFKNPLEYEWIFFFEDHNPKASITEVNYEKLNSAGIYVEYRKYKQGWFREKFFA